MNIFYFGLEPLKARYTYQLSKEWMPATFQPYVDAGKLEFIDVPGEFDPDQQIKVGAVLDAVGRGKFAMSQCSNFLDMINTDINEAIDKNKKCLHYLKSKDISISRKFVLTKEILEFLSGLLVPKVTPPSRL